MKRKIKSYLGLKAVTFALWVMELQPFGLWTDQDKENARKLWYYYDAFQADLT